MIENIEIKKKRAIEVKLPASRKIYVETNGSTVNQNKHNLRVPFREIALSPSRIMNDEIEENPPVRVYDTSGVWTDPGNEMRRARRLAAIAQRMDSWHAATSKNTKDARFCRRTTVI